MEQKERKEIAHTREQILAEFARFGGENAKETRVKEDTDGISVLEVQFPGEKPGEVVELSYCRKGGHGGDRSIVTTIEAVYYEDEMPVGGKTLANFVDGAWQYK